MPDKHSLLPAYFTKRIILQYLEVELSFWFMSLGYLDDQ